MPNPTIGQEPWGEDLNNRLNEIEALAINGDGGSFLPEEYGALGDGVTDDAPAIQSAIDAASVTGGVVLFRGSSADKSYLVQSSLVLAENVSLLNIDGLATMRPGGGTHSVSLIAGSSLAGYVVDSPATSTRGMSVIGMRIFAHSDPMIRDQQGGIRFRNANRGTIMGNVAANFGLEAALVEAGSAVAVIDNQLSGSFKTPSGAGVMQAVLKVDGTDHWLDRIQANAGRATVTDTNDPRVAGIWIDASYCRVGAVAGEFAEIGVYVSGHMNQFANSRADTNAGHGWVFADGVTNNTLVGCHANRNGAMDNDLWDGFVVGRNTRRNRFIGCMSGQLVGVATWQQRYGYRDLTSFVGVPAEDHNQYVSCAGQTNLVAVFNANADQLRHEAGGTGPLSDRPGSAGGRGSWWDIDASLVAFAGTNGTNAPTVSNLWRTADGGYSGNRVEAGQSQGSQQIVVYGGGATASSVLGSTNHPSGRVSAAQATVTGAGTLKYGMNPQIAFMAVVEAGIEYTALLRLKSSVSRTAQIKIDWWTAAQAFLSTSTGSSSASSTADDWGAFLTALTATAPANAAFASVYVQVDSAAVADIHAITQLDLHEGSGTAFIEP